MNPASVWICTVLFLCVLCCSCKAIRTGAYDELEVTRHPEGDDVLLKRDSPLLLSYTVCGSMEELNKYRLEITVFHRQSGVGENIEPVHNAPLNRKSDTYEAHGIAVSKWDATFSGSDHELCYEIPIRVWPDSLRVLDLSIELKLGIRIGRFPKKISVGTYTFRHPTQDPPTAVTSAESREASTTTSAFRLPFINGSTIQIPEGEGTVHTFRLLAEDSTPLNCKCDCEEDPLSQP